MQNAYSTLGCTEGGLIWYGVWGRIHGHMSLTQDKSQQFMVCLTGGLAEAVYVWWDSHQNYWQPLGFQQYHSEMTDERSCRPSTNGSADIYFEPPWAETRYLSYVTWELRPLTKEEYKQAWIDQEIRKKGKIPGKEKSESEEENDDGEDEESAVNKEASEYFVVVLDAVSNNLLIVVP